MWQSEMGMAGLIANVAQSIGVDSGLLAYS
jgi:hypothetical protein